jgi:hypothetical protein
MKNFLMTLVGIAFAASLWSAPSEASAANCNFNKNEKISMVSWIILIAGAALPAEDRGHAGNRFLDRRRKRVM